MENQQRDPAVVKKFFGQVPFKQFVNDAPSMRGKRDYIDAFFPDEVIQVFQ
jgi:hypothetical protein